MTRDLTTTRRSVHTLLFGFACTVGIFSYILYPARVFGDASGAALSIGWISAIIYGMASVGLKLLATHETWLYGTCYVKSHRELGVIIRYTSIVAASALVGVLMYTISFDLTTMEYSESLWHNFRAIAGVAAGILVVLPWALSKL